MTTIGPLMIGIDGLSLSEEERDLLQHPLVGGVILFTRNFGGPEQLIGLVAEIRRVRPELLIAVDHEGGRVQRFRTGFTVLPPAAAYGRAYDSDQREGLRLAELGGWIMAAELRACDIDLSFAPVLDLDYGVSTVIGDRAFHAQVDAVTRLAGAFIRGMRRAGMAATGKHFPGHGGVAADSHLELPVDGRAYADLHELDMLPFERLIATDLSAIMTAHVVYPAVDERPASFSLRWVRDELRRRLGFHGAVFCDDLGMAGAAVIGDPIARAQAALEAGCDMLPVCNDRAATIAILDGLRVEPDVFSGKRLAALRGAPAPGRRELLAMDEWREASGTLTAFRERAVA